ncbi:hypothetical protein EK21DRAFT_75043 [Setomelanomma holmii]|uniref:Uncharacterized protein n=1 Tax=Setomelanomma holmii TaxID=210430 RepID=A0A9P4H0I0_9PLEO|nr:hypothetical protein EK21DRAFT_75043 [Setomelanomma holmii]
MLFDKVPHDIHRLVAAELKDSCPSTVLALGQSSKSLRDAVLPFLYRELVLKKGASNSNARKAYQALIEKFRDDDQCEIAKYARSLAVKDDIPPEDLMMILNKISEHGTLRKLSWETHVHITRAILDKLHTTWPDLELSVCVLDRQNASNFRHRQMDMKLLSSPLLRKLIYTVYHQGHRADEPARSEWPKLTRALVAGGSVRFLTIDNVKDGTEYYGVKVIDDNEVTEKMMRLDITPGTRLPPLEELTIRENRYWGSSTYMWDEEHCRLLLDAMDWSHLRKLDFGADKPDAFFSVFERHLPDLKILRFGTQNDAIGPVPRFIDSVTALESLDIARAEYSLDSLWPSIMKHKDTLREIILRPTTAGYCQPQYTKLNRLEIIASEFPVLERLGWDAPCKFNVDAKYLEVFSSMKLKKLDLFLHVPYEASDFAAKLTQNAMGTISPPAFTKKEAAVSAIKMMKRIKAQNPWIVWLMLHFTRTGLEDRAQPYLMFAEMQVRRTKKKGGKNEYEIRGKQEWVGVTGLEDELQLVEE